MSIRSPFLLLLLLPTLGCDSSSMSPSAPEAPTSAAQAVARGTVGHFPLVLGATWTYAGTEWTRERLQGQADFGPARSRRFTRVAHAARWTDFPGIEYLVIENALTFEGTNPGPFQSLKYLREDAAALYSYPDLGGISGLVVAARVPSPRRMETILLAYPVHVGSTWDKATTVPGHSIEEPTFTVEAIEPTWTPNGIEPAARVRRRIEGETDLTWYGRSGVLRSWQRRTSSFTTQAGERGERERTDEERLTAVTGLDDQVGF